MKRNWNDNILHWLTDWAYLTEDSIYVVGLNVSLMLWWCYQPLFQRHSFHPAINITLWIVIQTNNCVQMDKTVQFNSMWLLIFHLRSSNQSIHHNSDIRQDMIWTKLMVGIRVRVCHPRRGWFISLMDCTFEKGKWKFGQMFQLKLTYFHPIFLQLDLDFWMRLDWMYSF